MKTSTLKVAFIGTGRISDLHALEYIANPKSHIAILCDQNQEAAKSKAQTWGLKDFEIESDYRKVLLRKDIDLVEILLPHHLHKAAALAAIEAGKAVSLQKPLGTNLAEAEELLGAVRKSNCPFRVFENFIFYPPIMKARELLEEGVIGELMSIRIKSNPGYSKTAWKVPPASTAWRQNRKSSGGGPLVFDDGHHKFALAWYFMGSPEEVHAFIGHTDLGEGLYMDAPSQISFRFPGQRIGNLEIVYSPELEVLGNYYPQDDRVELTGTKGVLCINGGHGQLAATAPLQLYRGARLKEYHNISTGWQHSFINATRHFIDALESGSEAMLTAENAWEILRFALAAERSAHREQRVFLNEISTNSAEKVNE